MMKPIFIAAVFVFFVGENLFAGEIQDKWIAKDKAYHALGSMMSTVLISKTSRVHLDFDNNQSKITAAGFSVSLGLFKELYDMKKPNNIFSWKDLISDIAGITIGLMILEIK